jgi:hypothetical protein
VNWRALVVVLVLGMFIAGAIRTIQGWPQSGLTAEERAMMEALAPALDSLVLQQEDLSSLSGEWEACESEPYTVSFQFRADEGYTELEGVEFVDDSSDNPEAGASFCGPTTGAYASSLVSLPVDNPEVVGRKLGLSKGDTEVLVQAFASDLGSSEELIDYRWLSTPELGDSSFAMVRSVLDVDTGARFEIYDFDFIRGVVDVSMMLEIPSSPTADDEARALAQTLDDRIAAKLDSLAAEVQAH